MTRGAAPVVSFALLVVLGVLPLAAPAGADDWPYAAGTSTQDIEGLATTLVLPSGLSADEPVSLLFVLHGLGGTATGMAGSFAGWAQDGYVVCAPKSKGQGWETDDLSRVKRIIAHLKKVLPIDARKVHGVGFSNGGWNLAPVVFDDDVHACSATWLAAGFDGGTVPKWAKEGLGAIAMAGSQDNNLRAARATVPALREKVRSVEVRVQEGIGHEFPRELMPYLQWWMGVQEGRLTAGDDRSFDWKEDLDAALAALDGAKEGGVMVWLFSPGDDEEATRMLQHEAFFDAEVRFLGGQLGCVRLERGAHEARVAEFKLESTPAVVVLDRKGKVKKTLEGKIKASKLSKALRSVAPERRMPED